ncbi:MAG TPA: hypothetical protein VI037_05385 [Nitrososphaera sp.]
MPKISPSPQKGIMSLASDSDRRDPSLPLVSTVYQPNDPECLSQSFGLFIVSADKHGRRADGKI